MTNTPEQYSQDLTIDRLTVLSEKLLDVLDEAHSFSESPNATAWFRGTANYGLPQGMLTRLAKDPSYPWLAMANQTMDYTVQVGTTLVQFVVDDPNNPVKRHRLKRNAVELHQHSLALEPTYDDSQLVWRFYLTPFSNGIDYSPSITLVGYDINENQACVWEYDTIISGPSAISVPEAVEIQEPVLHRKESRDKKFNEQ